MPLDPGEALHPHTAKVLLTWGSVAFELAGLTVVGWEILGDRSHARRVLDGKGGADLKVEFEEVIHPVDDFSERRTTWAD